jgi:hypothetical protein
MRPCSNRNLARRDISLAAPKIKRPKPGTSRERPETAALEQIPKKLTGFFDKTLLQQFDLARFLIDRMIPCDRKAR